jgi:DNA-binding SARP family transcriptional activator
MSLRHETGASSDGAPRLSLLGGFALELGRQELAVPLHVQRLLAFLGLRDRPLHRAYVAGSLWTDLSQEHAYGSLRTAVWRTGRLPCSVVHATSTHLALAPSVAVDAGELAASAERALHQGAAEPGDVNLLSGVGELLPDWYDDWVLQERERLRLLRLLALEAAGERLIGARRYREASIVALAAVGADPLRESAHRLLIRSHLAAGNAADALRQFDLCRTLLRRSLGLEPSSQTTELVRGIGSRPSLRDAV